MNMEILVAIFNGKIIGASKNNIEKIDYKLRSKYENL
jgi:hypothetical protein